MVRDRFQLHSEWRITSFGWRYHRVLFSVLFVRAICLARVVWRFRFVDESPVYERLFTSRCTPRFI